MQTQIEELVAQLQVAQTYIMEYAAANELGSSFFGWVIPFFNLSCLALAPSLHSAKQKQWGENVVCNTKNCISFFFFRENFLSVEIFYKELTERKVSQQKAYDFSNLLSKWFAVNGLSAGNSTC